VFICAHVRVQRSTEVGLYKRVISYTAVPSMDSLEQESERREFARTILQNFEMFSSYSPTLDALLVFVRIRYLSHNADIKTDVLPLGRSVLRNSLRLSH
jgi:hypothetical protein